MQETTTTNGKTYPRFMSMGTGYDTLSAVAARLAILAMQDHIIGPSDGRTTIRETLLEDLNTFARRHGSRAPSLAIEMALCNVMWVNGHPGTPSLSLLEELEITILKVKEKLIDND